MSYLRGDIYVWSDGDRVHFWARDGYDGWDVAGWNVPDPESNPSGVALPEGTVDEYVVMRFAEMLEEGSIVAAVERALSKGAGNGGCIALAKCALLLREFAATPVPRPGAA